MIKRNTSPKLLENLMQKISRATKLVLHYVHLSLRHCNECNETCIEEMRYFRSPFSPLGREKTIRQKYGIKIK